VNPSVSGFSWTDAAGNTAKSIEMTRTIMPVLNDIRAARIFCNVVNLDDTPHLLMILFEEFACMN
jgi:hypothetical protein